jgi:hypothetical protein
MSLQKFEDPWWELKIHRKFSHFLMEAFMVGTSVGWFSFV